MDPTVIRMAILRLGFGTVSIVGGLLMLYFNRVESALKINAFIGSVGPFVFLAISGIGLLGLSDHIEIHRLLMLVVGIILIMLGTR